MKPAVAKDEIKHIQMSKLLRSTHDLEVFRTGYWYGEIRDPDILKTLDQTESKVRQRERYWIEKRAIDRLFTTICRLLWKEHRAQLVIQPGGLLEEVSDAFPPEFRRAVGIRAAHQLDADEHLLELSVELHGGLAGLIGNGDLIQSVWQFFHDGWNHGNAMPIADLGLVNLHLLGDAQARVYRKLISLEGVLQMMSLYANTPGFDCAGSEQALSAMLVANRAMTEAEVAEQAALCEINRDFRSLYAPASSSA